MKKTSSNLLGFIVLILFVLSCANSGKTNYDTAPKKLVSTSSSPAPLVSNTTLTNTAPVPASTITTSAISKSDKKLATVISENANLRETANSSGEIVQEVAEGTEVEVIKQTGAWFKVRTGGKEGWLHGNTIKLLDAEVTKDKEAATEPPTVIFIKPTPLPTRAAEAANPSGATARCRDGSLSYSAHRQGTCSHHGGVSEWLNAPSASTEYSAPSYSTPSSSSGYIRGPRGGCYTYTSGGNKRYVDRSLCN